jgi:hypothetical protein
LSVVDPPARVAHEPRLLRLPEPRGPLTEALFRTLAGPADGGEGARLAQGAGPAAEDEALLGDHDAQLALYVCYELHYAGIEDVDERWEWDPGVLAFRAGVERRLERGLRRIVPSASDVERAAVGETLQRLVDEEAGPPLSRYVETQGTLGQMREHAVHRSAYQLKEADPHTWAIPRLTGRPKSALLEIQADEYGGGRPERMHSRLFAATMEGLGLDARYGAYVALLPGLTLATVNLVSMLGLHRRLRGALTGHLAVFEMTSAVPNRRYGNALRRLGFGRAVTDFYDEHVEADAVHESIAAWDLADGLARSEPALAADVLFGARALLAVEARWAGMLLDAFREDRSALLAPLRQR